MEEHVVTYHPVGVVGSDALNYQQAAPTIFNQASLTLETQQKGSKTQVLDWIRPTDRSIQKVKKKLHETEREASR